MWLPLALSFALVGCADNAEPPVSPLTRVNVLVNQDRLPPPERFQWELGEQIEAFGGLFADSSGGLVALTTALADTNALRAAVRARVAASNSTARSPVGTERPLLMRQARFTYRSLLSWKTALSMSDVSGIIGGIGVVESRNRILVLVRDPGSVAQIRQSALSLGIPHDALAIGGTRAEPAQNIQTASFRPTIGGIRIFAPGGCTLWGNAVVNGIRYGITNSHCTSVMGTVTGDAVTQAGGYIGSEAIDPPWNVQERHPDCISGALPCRFSDAAAFIYDEGATSEKTMARISGLPCGYACYGPLTAILTNRTISSVIDYPMDGEIVDKVGSTTGWTRGPVEGSCFDIKVDVGGGYRRYLCTVRVITSAFPGDSGSPVFFLSGDDTARPTGILWGRDVCRNTFPNLDDGSCPRPGYEDYSSPSNAMYMNAWWTIRQELGFPDASVASF